MDQRYSPADDRTLVLERNRNPISFSITRIDLQVFEDLFFLTEIIDEIQMCPLWAQRFPERVLLF